MMQWCKKQLLLKGVLLIIFNLSWNCVTVAGRGVNLGACDSTTINCQCGSPGYSFPIEVKQCTYFYRWKPSCKPCDDIKEDNLCPRYSTCLQCRDGEDRCIDCPQGMYGDWCTTPCNCQNGGECKRDGTCTCPEGYYGDKCQLIKGCPTLHPPAFGGLTMDSAVIKLGTSATFHCDHGFKLDGDNTLYCLESQRWSSSVPSCLRLCPMPTVPSNGFVQGSTPDLMSGSTAVFTCKPGFALQGSTTSKCLPDGTWSHESPRCEKISFCVEPFHPENSERQIVAGILGDFSQGTKIHYECREGNEMLGSKTIECKEDRKWTSAPPTCISGKLCEDPGEMDNGDRIIRSKIEGYFPPGSSIEFRCHPLYYLLGSTVITCNKDGNWSSKIPGCLKFTTCQQPEDTPNLNVEILPPHLLPKSVPFRRVSGNGSVIRSRGFGRRRRFNITSVKIDPLPSSVSSYVSNSRQKREVSPLPLGHHHVGSQAKFSCENRYYKLMGSQIRTCQIDGKWSGTPPICIPTCGLNNAPVVPSIINGTPSVMGHWPWQVAISSLMNPDEPDPFWLITCGGSIINERWVLTAAHCVTYDKSNEVISNEEITLYFGKYYRNDSLDDNMVQKQNASAIYIHPDYQPESLDADIALIKLQKPIVFTSRVLAVCLPEYHSDRSDERLKEGNKGMVTGWGQTETGGLSSVLRQAEIPVVDNRRCEQEYRNQNIHLALSWNSFCAGYDEGVQDSCTGDSGGPFVFPFDERRDRWVQEGIVSWGAEKGCGKAKHYSGFTRVQRFLPWIEQFI